MLRLAMARSLQLSRLTPSRVQVSMPEPSRRLVWMRAVDRDPDLEDDLDHFIALDGEEEVGVVKLVPAPASEVWVWSLWLTHPGPAFRLPTNGRTRARGEAVRELLECWQVPGWFAIED